MCFDLFFIFNTIKVLKRVSVIAGVDMRRRAAAPGALQATAATVFLHVVRPRRTRPHD